MADRPALRALADRVGILAEYIDQTGTERRVTTDRTRERLLAALGFDVSSEASARHAAEQWDADAPAAPAPRDAGRVTSCIRIADLGLTPVFGIVASLFTLRSDRNWGSGDAADLAELAAMAGRWGADFVGVNPLHAIRNRGPEVSPYGPVSRLFRNPLYIAPDRVPELGASEEARSLLASKAMTTEVARLRASDRVEYERVMAVKRAILVALHDTFDSRRSSAGERANAYERYRKAHEPGLTAFATWAALDEFFRSRGRGDGWTQWPSEYHDSSGPAVAEFREAHAREVDYHRWLQFVLDEQLTAAAAAAKSAGARLGLYQDLAIGALGGGADSWMHRDLFVPNVALGAPPDELARSGQNWGLPPLNPHSLRASGYAYWRALVRAALEHAGALRIDHILGLFRQFWIPDGFDGSEGAYIRFPTEDMLGVVAEESRRARAIIVGEDLGTVPPEVEPTLERWGVYSSRVLYFEREHDTGFKPSSSYPANALATANTHDMATLAAFWKGQDIDLRHELGLIDAKEAARQRKRRAAERTALIDRLRRENGALRADPEPAIGDIIAGVHRLLCRSPAELVGLSLDDIVGEERPVNVPGVAVDRFPSWQRRLTVSLEELRSRTEVHEVTSCRAVRRPR